MINTLKSYRDAIGMTQAEAAKLLGISRQAYSEKERGKIPFKPREMVILKNKFLSVNSAITIDELFFAGTYDEEV